MEKVLEMNDIRKEFQGVIALDNVTLNLHKGEVLGLLGENGAGKSTLMKILSGTYTPDAGGILINGREVKIDNPIHARELGIGIIHQELSLSANLTVAENIYAMQEPQKFGLINDKLMEDETQKLFEQFGISIDPSKLVSELSLSNQQLVEIVKALSFEPNILIMDEPTSALSDSETEKLFEIVNRLTAEGISIIYISHRMKEIFEITNSVMVLRDGNTVGSERTQEVTEDELIKMMVGRKMDDIYPNKPFPYTSDEKLLSLENFHHEKYYHDINLHVKPGEIVGLFGLMGAGRTEIAEGIFGIHPKERGTMYFRDQKVHIKNPSEAIEKKIAFVTEDRKEQGLILSTDVRENIVMGSIDKLLSKFGLIQEKKENELAEKHREKLRIKTPSIDQIVNRLSGGNQQKIVLSKWFEKDPDLLILDEPTRGIDVGSKYEIYELMIEMAKRGVGILLISSELPEVLNMADRVLVVNEKRIIKEVDPKTSSQEEIMTYITGRSAIDE